MGQEHHPPTRSLLVGDLHAGVDLAVEDHGILRMPTGIHPVDHCDLHVLEGAGDVEHILYMSIPARARPVETYTRWALVYVLAGTWPCCLDILGI